MLAVVPLSQLNTDQDLLKISLQNPAKAGFCFIMKNFFIVNKKEGETPLQALENFRKKISKKDGKYLNTKMTYAGRLDPMASGLLIILSGEETKNKEKYLKLDKEYRFEILFGFATDTYDILGKVIPHRNFLWGDQVVLEKKIKENLKYFKGEFVQKYPIYSSKTVNGKQLFEYARSAEDVEIPEHKVHVKTLKFLKLRKIGSKSLLENIEKRILKVDGDFRQKEILKIWQKSLKYNSEYVLKSNLSRQACLANFSARRPAKGFLKHIPSLFIGSFKIKCGSGTYVRSIASGLGDKMGVPALAYGIKRTKIGKWSKVT